MPLYECPECGEHTEAPVEATDSGVVPLDCPNTDCESETLTDVDNLCENGRTTFVNHRGEPPCYEEATHEWPDEDRNQMDAGEVQLCEEHYEELTTFPLPDGAIGRCSMEDCNIAVYEKVDGELICEACE